MAAVSKHPLDVYNWIKKVIYSCETHDQLRNCRRLINNYDDIYPMYSNQYIALSKLEIDQSFLIIDIKYGKNKQV